MRSLGTRPYPINDTACKNSDYIGNFVYKNDTLQYILSSEGRARPILDTFNNTRFVYDYFIKDHLGNVRSTVTAEPMNLAYIASHEIAMAGVEQLIFDNIPNVRASKPGGGGSDVMAVRLNGGESDKRIGTAIMLHVMPGDRFTISADAFYEGSYQQSTEEVGSDVIVQSLASALLGGTTYEGVPVSELPDNARLASSILSNPSLPTTLSTLVDQTNNPDAPKAHLNILFFDENMRLIPQASSVTQVTQNNLNNANGWTVLTPTGTGGGPHPGAPGPGYVVIFVDNQSIGKDVWFDNLMVGHYTSKVQEESHYYPFGLTLQTDVQTPEVTKQVYKYNGIDLEKLFGLETYDAFYRGLDPQLGRFNSIDPQAATTFSISPYVSMGNNPISNVDFLGDIFTFATAGLQASYNNLRKENNDRQAGYVKELGGLDLTTDAGAKRAGELSSLINAHADFNTQLDAMEASSAEFHISNQIPTHIPGAAAETFYNFDAGRVQFNMGGDNPWIASLAHELRHGYGYLAGEIASSEKFGDPLYDMMDEAQGNLTGLLFTSHPQDAVNGSYKFMDNNAVTGPNGTYPWLKGKTIQLDANTPISILRNYVNDKIIPGPINNNTNNANITAGEVMRNINDQLMKLGRAPRYRFGEYLKK